MVKSSYKNSGVLTSGSFANFWERHHFAHPVYKHRNININNSIRRTYNNKMTIVELQGRCFLVSVKENFAKSKIKATVVNK